MYYDNRLREIADSLRKLGDMPEELARIGKNIDHHKEAIDAASERENQNDEIKQKWSEKLFAEDQIEEIDRGRRDDRNYATHKSIKTATWIAAIGALFYGGVATYQAREMRRATKATEQAAYAACLSAQLSRNSLVNMQRSQEDGP